MPHIFSPEGIIGIVDNVMALNLMVNAARRRNTTKILFVIKVGSQLTPSSLSISHCVNSITRLMEVALIILFNTRSIALEL